MILIQKNDTKSKMIRTTLNIHTMKDIIVKLGQLAFEYGLHNYKSGDEYGKEEYNGMLVLLVGTIKYLEVWSM